MAEDRPAELPQPAALFISGMLTGLAAAVHILDGSTGEKEMERVETELSAAIGRAVLTGSIPTEGNARVFAALHRSAEQDVSRVIDLYEQWVKAGPPPLGTPVSRWWDARLVELHDAILPPIREQRPSKERPDVQQ
ncbi:hypothetical protein [Streptomyces nigra]|uniref:hypothetical protein n=1 Tax=Streptomyces nigra TaxID=1827580 RepID=UPI00363CA70F